MDNTNLSPAEIAEARRILQSQTARRERKQTDVEQQAVLDLRAKHLLVRWTFTEERSNGASRLSTPPIPIAMDYTTGICKAVILSRDHKEGIGNPFIGYSDSELSVQIIVIDESGQALLGQTEEPVTDPNQIDKIFEQLEEFSTEHPMS